MQLSHGITRVGIPLQTGVDNDASLKDKVRLVTRNIPSQFRSSIRTMKW